MCVCVCVCVCVQSCLTLHDPVDCSLPGSSAHGILQARIPEWVAISSSSRPPQPRDQTRVSCISCIGRPVFFLPLGLLGKPPVPEKPAKNVGISTLPSGIPSAQKGTRTGGLLHCSWLTGLISGAFCRQASWFSASLMLSLSLCCLHTQPTSLINERGLKRLCSSSY